jgi:putative ATP-dependent endonuclease of OLD family
MRIGHVSLHNFRSITDGSLRLGQYSLMVGPNNSGKSNFIDALCCFYDEKKYDHARDFPKTGASDSESWIEVEYQLAEDEIPTIKAEYLIDADRFRLRKWFHPPDKAKKGLFGYEAGALSENLFYGWKNVAQGKLGRLVYIPAVSRLEEQTKMSGPSPLRELLTSILGPIITSSSAFAQLKKEFEGFSKAIKHEETVDKRSVKGLEDRINTELVGWHAAFRIEISTPEQDQIIKNFIKHSLLDEDLGEDLDPDSFGHGLQRHLIFTLIRVAASYAPPKPQLDKKEFAPQLDLVLFEEPEAFLHPPQQTVLDSSLRLWSREEGRQVLAASHSPLFVSCNTDDIANLLLVRRTDGVTRMAQIHPSRLKEIFESNEDLAQAVGDQGGLGDEAWLDVEAARHFLWLNPERSAAFFANLVLIVEGLSEQALISELMKEGKLSVEDGGMTVLSFEGKYNIPRFMKLLGELGIPHCVLYDRDSQGNNKANDAVNMLIENSRNAWTRAIDCFPLDLEAFLGLRVPEWALRRKKASFVLVSYKKGNVLPARIDALLNKLRGLVSPSTTDIQESVSR